MQNRFYEYSGAPAEVISRCPTCQQSIIDESGDLAVFVDGACSRNGFPDAVAGIGVYHSSDSPYNVSRLLGGSGPQTNQRAEIHAATEALKQITQRFIDGGPCHHRPDGVVIITDSAYVANVMTDSIYKWKQNGWKNHNGEPVVNAEDFGLLERLVEGSQSRVRFWQVPRKYNQCADKLAKMALGIGLGH
jgi:ribonuclease HI